MRRVIRLLFAIAAVLSLLSTAGAAAASFEGPRLSYVREGEPLQGEELLTSDPAGAHTVRLARVPDSGGALTAVSWSGDGAQVAVGSSDGLGFSVPPRPAIFVVSAEGGARRWVRGTERGFRPVFAPDGKTLAFARVRYRYRPGKRFYLSFSTWVVDAGGGRPRQLTPWRDRLFVIPSSFSPDGSRLAAVRQRRDEAPEIVEMPLDGGRASLLVKNGLEPAYSPDGKALAFLRLRRTGFLHLIRVPVYGGDLFVSGADGGGIRRLTFTPDRREAGPSWDPSGERLVFTQRPAKLTFEAQSGTGSSIIEINADGTCRHRLLFTYGLSYRDAAWQPGPGREAGRIAC